MKTNVTKKKLIGIASIILILIVIIISNSQSNTVYRETTVEKGNLTVGITKTGTVAVEDTEQIFDVDISEYSSSDSDDYSWSNSSAMNPFQGMAQILQDSSTETSTSSERQLKVEELFAKVGEIISENDPICSLSEETVNSIRNALADDEAEAKTTSAQLRAPLH